jgi:predicted nucleic acid-binding protein
MLAVAVADAGPLHYLVLIDAIHLLPRLFPTVLVPDIVRDEISSAGTPALVRDWIAQPPPWLRILPTPPLETLPFPKLDAGERAALALAVSRRPDMVLIDDRRGVVAARAQGLVTVGTLGLLDRAASEGFVDLAAAVARLTATNFRYPPELLRALLAQHGRNDAGYTE